MVMQDREEVRLSVEKRRLGSYANRSRWNIFFNSLHDFQRQAEHSLRVRVKVVSRDNISDWKGGWLTHGSGYFEHIGVGPMLFSYIEWLDIESIYEKHRGKLVSPEVINVQEEIQKIVLQSKLTSISEKNYTRVWGYK